MNTSMTCPNCAAQLKFARPPAGNPRMACPKCRQPITLTAAGQPPRGAQGEPLAPTRPPPGRKARPAAPVVRPAPRNLGLLLGVGGGALLVLLVGAVLAGVWLAGGFSGAAPS